MIGYEDEPSRSAEICVCEIFGRDVGAGEARVGMGVHPFGDPDIVDDFAAEPVPIDARDFHVYTAEWTPERRVVLRRRRAGQDRGPVTRLPDAAHARHLRVPARARRGRPRVGYPKELVVDYVRGYRRSIQSL